MNICNLKDVQNATGIERSTNSRTIKQDPMASIQAVRVVIEREWEVSGSTREQRLEMVKRCSDVLCANV